MSRSDVEEKGEGGRAIVSNIHHSTIFLPSQGEIGKGGRRHKFDGGAEEIRN